MWGESRGKENKSSLAHRAQQKYNAGKYIEAIDALQKLAEEIAPERDSKVQHNLLLAGFVAGNTSAKELELSLRNLLSSILDAADKKVDAGADCEVKFAAERESSFIRYNLAACLFHQKQYAAASAVLEAVMRKIDPIDERVAMHVCFLYLDIILHSSRGCVTTERERFSALKKAQSIMVYLEKPHRFNGQLGHHHESSAAAASSADASGSSSSSSAVESEQQRKNRWDVTEFRFRLHLYKAKFVLLAGNLKTAKKEVKSALEIFQKEIKSRERTDESGAAANSTALTTAGSWDKTSTSISYPSLQVQNSTALFLKANLEYLRKNYKKCVKLLASCSQEAVDESVFLNNMGCIHFQMGQRKAAQSYFSRALEASGKSKKPHADAVVVTFEILYNNGVHLLLQGEYSLAFRCFHASSRLLFNRPKLWLRMGECCTAAFAQQQKLVAVAGNKSGLIQGIVGSGSHRRVLLPTSIPTSASQDIELPEKNGKLNHSQYNQANGPNGAPKMSLPFAAKCFKNVVLLCNQLQETANNVNGESAAASAPSSSPDTEGIDTAVLSREALDNLRQKALVNLSYVYLSMYEPQLAITSAKELLALPTCSRSNRFLARSYAAEALCMLSRAAEATEVLQSERELLVMADDYAREAKIQASRARSGIHVNNATTLLLQGRMSEAEESVTRAVRENPNCRESLELLVYVLLKKGDTKKAARVLKEAQVAQ
ncbi:Ccr4-not transcription complex subunit, partial [Globisporangium splendens]